MANDFGKINWKSPRGSKIARILSGQSKSVDVGGRLGVPTGLGAITGLIFPSNLNSAVKVYFEVSNDDHTYYPLYDIDGARLYATVKLSGAVSLGVWNYHQWDFIRVQTVDVNGDPVTQTANKDIIIILMLA